MPLGMWDLPGPGIEPMSFELADGFLTTGPPGKPRMNLFFFFFFTIFKVNHSGAFSPCSTLFDRCIPITPNRYH